MLVKRGIIWSQQMTYHQRLTWVFTVFPCDPHVFGFSIPLPNQPTNQPTNRFNALETCHRFPTPNHQPFAAAHATMSSNDNLRGSVPSALRKCSQWNATQTSLDSMCKYNIYIYIYIWGAVKIYYNCLVCFWRVIVFWGGPAKFQKVWSLRKSSNENGSISFWISE